jgi:hypothetical protein
VSWDESLKHARQSTSSVFKKLVDNGDTVVAVMASEPIHYERTFDDGGKATRFLFNIFVPGGEGMKVLELNSSTLEQLATLKGEIDLKQRLVKIRRAGRRGDKRTQYSVTDGGPIPTEVLAELSKAKLHDLTRYAQPGSGRAGASSDPVEKIDIKF